MLVIAYFQMEQCQNLGKLEIIKRKKKREQKRQASRKVKDDTGISTGDEKEGLNFPPKGCEWVKLPQKG